MPKNSAAGGIYGGFTASKIRRLIRRAIIFPADFRRTNFRRRIRRSAAAEGSNCKFSELMAIKDDQSVFVAWQVNYYRFKWIIENTKHFITRSFN